MEPMNTMSGDKARQEASPLFAPYHQSGEGLLQVQCSCGGRCGQHSQQERHEHDEAHCGHDHEHHHAEHHHGHDQSHGDHGHAHDHDGDISWKHLAVAGLFAALSEGFHFAQEGDVLGETMHAAWTVGGLSVLEALPLLFALVAIVLGGLETYRAGWRALTRLEFNMMALMSVAVTGAVLIGQYPEAAMVMVLFNISEAIEDRVLLRARRAIRELLALSPEKATVRQSDGSWRETDIREVPLGALVCVKPGERIALDGVVREGRSAVDQAPITGESMPVDKGPGDTVFAGTINTSGGFDFEVTARSTDTTLARIIHAVEQAQGRRAPIQRFVDSFARWYTPFIFALSFILALVPPLFLGAEWKPSIYRALVVLVIGCPCALVISTPVTIVSGMAVATRLGMLVKGGMFLEMGRHLRVLALDKTGTLTHGRPRRVDAEFFAGTDTARAEAIAAGLAALSDHPVSAALASYAKEQGVAPADIHDFQALAGRGVQGRLGDTVWYLGNLRMMRDLGLASETLEYFMEQQEAQGRTVTILAGEGLVQALFAVADTIRESSVEAVRELRTLGVRTVMLTGDNENAARVIAKQAGVDEFRAGLLPEEKFMVIEELAKQKGQGSRGRVGMAGDGINDAPALARADIGFAMAGGGTDTAMETADVALMDDDLRKIPRFIRLSQRVYGILVQNIALALGVKALFFVLTLCGYTSMWMAVFADVGTALMVVGNGLRAGRR